MCPLWAQDWGGAVGLKQPQGRWVACRPTSASHCLIHALLYSLGRAGLCVWVRQLVGSASALSRGHNPLIHEFSLGLDPSLFSVLHSGPRLYCEMQCFRTIQSFLVHEK